MALKPGESQDDFTTKAGIAPRTQHGAQHLVGTAGMPVRQVAVLAQEDDVPVQSWLLTAESCCSALRISQNL